jgi:hypothetical protein
MDNTPGWRTDPERDDLERFWSGSAWTDRRRPAGKAGSLRVPGHLPELQRALTAATADIDAVEDRLSTLFDRTSGTGRTSFDAGTQRRSLPAPALADDVDDDESDDDDESALAELDTALATEQPEEAEEPRSAGSSQAKRGFFRRT